MSAISPLSISDRIVHPLREVSQRQWTMLAARGMLKTLVVGLSLVLAASLLLGFLPGIPAVLRIAFAVLTWATVLWWTIKSLKPALHRWSLTDSAQRVDSLLGDSQERISSAVELSQAEAQFRGSPELVNHLVRQAEGDAARINSAAVVPFKAVFPWMLTFVPVLALWIFFAFNIHTATPFLQGLFATVMPWKIPPPLLADIIVSPGDKTLDQGDPLAISVTVSAVGKKSQHASLVRAFTTGQSVSQNMEQTAASQFSLALDPPPTGFRYQVTTDRGSSPWYTITVNPRPAISRMDVRYDYPKYTALESKNYVAADGSIDAVMGTQVTLTITTTNALVMDKSQLIFDDGKPTRSVVPLVATDQPNVYSAAFTVTRSGEYLINLVNNYNLGNKDDDPRTIIAELDLPPSINILTPKEQITVRPDDEVTVTYAASDDYGVSKIDALIQVDDHPQRIVPVAIKAKDRRAFKEAWQLSVEQLLKLENAPDASRITYQFRATDNRDPDPQTDVSQVQTLIISKNEQKSFQEKLNEKRKEDLMAAIRKAIDRLNQAAGPVATLRDQSARLANPDLMRQACETRDKLSKTGHDLSVSSAEFFETPFAVVAHTAQDIADGDIAHAADDIARLSLDAGAKDQAREDGQLAWKETITARDALERLLQKVEEAERKAAAAQELKQAAKEQAAVAKAMEEHPETKDQNNQKQNDAINKLNEALRNDPSLQNAEAKQLAAKVAELEKAIEKQQEKQTELQNQTAKQEENQQAQDQANALAEQQKNLNDQVQQFAKDDKQPIDQAHAQTPDPKQSENLVKNIEKHDLQQSSQQAQQQADQLKQDAKQLKDQANNPNNLTPDQQNQQQKDQQNQQAAQDAQNQAADAAKDLKNQANPDKPNPDSAKQAAEKVAKAAEQIQQQADKVKDQNAQGAKNADVQKAAEAAKADAQQAAQDAQQAAAAQDPKDAQQAADKAQQEIAKAGQELADAAKGEMQADKTAAQQQNQQMAAKAADQAQALGDQQQQIADALKEQAQQQADAQQNAQRRNRPPNSRNRSPNRPSKPSKLRRSWPTRRRAIRIR